MQLTARRRLPRLIDFTAKLAEDFSLIQARDA